MDKETFAAVDHYYQDLFLSADPNFDQINQNAAAEGLPSIQVSPLQGKFLQLMVQVGGAKRVLEIGTLGGYSTAWLASELPQDGLLISLELDPHHARVARNNLDLFSFLAEIQIRVGDGIQLIESMVQEGAEPFDLIFIDADKPGYADYLEAVVKLSRTGTLIIADNVVRGGKIIDPTSTDTNVLGIQRFNQRLINHPRLKATMLQTVGARSYDGFTFILVDLDD